MNYAIKDASNVWFYDRATMKPIMYTDYLNKFSLELSSEAVFAKAKGVNKIAFDGTKEGTATLEAEVYELKFLALLLGSDFVEEKTNIARREVFEVGKSIQLKDTPLDKSVIVYSLEKDKRTHIKEVKADVKTKEVTIKDSVTESKYVVVYYLTEKAKSKKLTISTDTRSKNLILIGQTVARNEFGEDEIVEIKVCNCKPQTKINLEFSAESVASFSAVFDLLADEDNKMVEMSLIED